MTTPEHSLQDRMKPGEDAFLCAQSVHEDIWRRATEKERARIVAWLRQRGRETWPDEPHFGERRYKEIAGRLRLQSANFHGMADVIEAGEHA